MFIVMLKFSTNKDSAGEFMEGHNTWVERGFKEGVFLMTGTLQPKRGGIVIAHDLSLADLQKRVSEDPFVKEKVVSAEILEVTPSEADERLNFILEE